LTRYRYRTTGVHVLQHLLFQLTHILPQVSNQIAQLGVFAFQNFHLILQLGDAFEFALATLAGRDTVALTLPFEFDALLGLHVDGAQGLGRLGHRLGFILDGNGEVFCNNRNKKKVINMCSDMFVA
jgi:hypothetical protein